MNEKNCVSRSDEEATGDNRFIELNFLRSVEEPKPTKGCPRANGIYRHYDNEVCDKFVNCVDGKTNELSCPPGLVYDDSKSNCAWPTDSLRKDCINTKRGTLMSSIMQHSEKYN